MRIGLLSDTHGYLDPALFGYFAGCDELWHAGDIGEAALIEELRRFKPLRGVYGNIDGADVRNDFPHDLEWDCEGVRVYMTHIGGYPGNYDLRVRSKLTASKPALFICGHSHILRVMRDPKLGLLHMNPGACGHHGFHIERTVLRFNAESGVISGVEAIELGPRGRRPK